MVYSGYLRLKSLEQQAKVKKCVQPPKPTHCDMCHEPFKADKFKPYTTSVYEKSRKICHQCCFNEGRYCFPTPASRSTRSSATGTSGWWRWCP